MQSDYKYRKSHCNDQVTVCQDQALRKLSSENTHTHTQAVTNFYSIERKNKSFKKQDSSSTNTNVNLFQPKNDPYTDQNNNNLPA